VRLACCYVETEVKVPQSGSVTRSDGEKAWLLRLVVLNPRFNVIKHTLAPSCARSMKNFGMWLIYQSGRTLISVPF
jgi:hypothetical protein